MRYTRVYKSKIKSGNCPVCGKLFFHARNKTCSEKCKRKLIDEFTERQKRSLAAKSAKGRAESPENDFRERTEFGEPTDAPPGSFEKFIVLQQRAAAGLALWHPDDRCDFNGLRKVDLLRPPAESKPRLVKDESGTAVKVGGKNLAE